MKITLLDIETFPNLVYTWGLFKQNVGINQIVRDWSMASMAWKYLGERRVSYADCRTNPNDDSELMAQIWEVLNDADIIVGQNSNHFDLRKINARLIELGYPPPSPYRTIDTKVAAQKVAMFTSNKLEWLAKHLSEQEKDDHGKYPGFVLWSECFAGNPDAWEEMRKYNMQDVRTLEDVYLKLRPWMTDHPNIVTGQDGVECPKCGSENLERRGYARTNFGLYPRFHCKDCGGWARGRYTENTLPQRKSLLRDA